MTALVHFVHFVHKPSARLRGVAERASFALGHVYALAASSVLNRVEQLEDLRAERKYRQRGKPRLTPAHRTTVAEQKSSNL